jgi:hypothetical protein
VRLYIFEVEASEGLGGFCHMANVSRNLDVFALLAILAAPLYDQGMKKRSFLVFILLFLVACQPLGTAPAPTNTLGLPTATPLPTPLPTQASTLPPTAAPIPTLPPAAAATSTTVTGPQAEKFSDCALLPALASCGGKLPLAGELVLSDPASKRLVVADFKTGTAWQVPWQAPALSAPSGLSFSPSGKLLAVLPPRNTGFLYVIYNAASGAQVQQATPHGISSWTSQDSFTGALFRTVWSAGGDQAWIDFNTALVHLRFAAQPDKDVTWPASPAPSDQIPQAVAWAPGSDLLLFEQHFAANSMWINGGALSTLNVKTGEIRDLKANLKLDFSFQWHPTEKGVLVFGDSSSSPIMGGQTLAVLNLLTGQLSHPIKNENVSISSPSWLPDGKTILFAAFMPGDASQPGDSFAAPAIYLIDRDGSNARSVTKPPQGSRDSRPQFLTDGVNFVYYRADTQKMTFTLRLAALDGSLDGPVTGPLPLPPLAIGGDYTWDASLVYRP